MRFLLIVRAVAKAANKLLVAICLTVVYLVICIYRPFRKTAPEHWHTPKAMGRAEEWEQTRHMW